MTLGKDNKKLYVVLKECWIEYKHYYKGQSIRLLPEDAEYWISRGWLKLFQKDKLEQITNKETKAK